MRRGTLYAVLSLVLCCVFWGLSFPLMQMAADQVARAGGWIDRSIVRDVALRSTYIGWRFGLSGLLYGVLTLRWQRGYGAHEVRGGVIVAMFFAAGNILQMIGLRYALPSVSSVLTSMVVVFTPFAQYFLLRRRVGAATWQAVVLALVGVIVLSFPNPSAAAPLTLTTQAPVPWLGEGATLLASTLFTGQVLSVDHFGRSVEPRRLTFVMFAAASIVTLAFGVLLGGGALHTGAIVSALVTDPHFWSVNVAMVVICSVGAFHLMNTAQPLVSPAAAAVIYCMEPVFATAWSVVLGTESITWLTLAGGGLVVLAMIRLARATE